MKLTTLQQIENKLLAGVETMYLHIEEDWQFDTVEVNVKKLLQAIAINEEYRVDGYSLYTAGRNTDRDGTVIGLAKDDLFADSGCYNVFADEQQAIDFCVKHYIEDMIEDSGECCSIAEATKYVLENSYGTHNV